MKAPAPCERRFWALVDVRGPDECWPWRGRPDKAGYGRFGVRVTSDKWVSVYAHRTMYELVIGPIPEGLQIDHVCHSVDLACPGGCCEHRICVNPAHLEPVTNRENDMRGRRTGTETHCKRGHERTAENTYVTPEGDRHCNDCRRYHARNYQRRRREAA